MWSTKKEKFKVRGVNMRVFAKTDIGKARDVNEDYFYIPENNENIQLYILADGMGGYNGGEIASNLAVNSLKSYITNNFNTIAHNGTEIKKLIKSAIEYANMVVCEKGKEQQELAEMGTTLEVCLIYNNIAYIGHVGDSRIYRINKNEYRLLTIDHSYVEKLIKDGTITKEESYNHPKKNMLLKAVGCSTFVEPDILEEPIKYGDIILMASDGLTNMLSDEEIYTYLMQDIQNADKNMIQRANELGGYDNITVVIVENK